MKSIKTGLQVIPDDELKRVQSVSAFNKGEVQELPVQHLV